MEEGGGIVGRKSAEKRLEARIRAQGVEIGVFCRPVFVKVPSSITFEKQPIASSAAAEQSVNAGHVIKNRGFLRVDGQRAAAQSCLCRDHRPSENSGAEIESAWIVRVTLNVLFDQMQRAALGGVGFAVAAKRGKPERASSRPGNRPG